MDKITWTNGVTKLNKDTMDDFQSNIESAINEVDNKIDDQIVMFDFTTMNGVTKNNAGVNKGFYNKLTKQVSIYFLCDLPEALAGKNLAILSFPTKFAPSKMVFFVGLMVGVDLVQLGVLSNGNIEAYSFNNSSTQIRGCVSYFVD